MTLWSDLPTWGAREWEAFLTRAALEPRTYGLLFALGTVGAFLGGAALSPETTHCLLALYALAVLAY